MEMSYSWQFNVVWQNLDVFFRGAIITVGLTIATCIIGTVLGLLIAILGKSKTKYITIPIRIYVNVTRAVPPLVWLIWFYYCLPIVLGIRLGSFSTAVLALSIGGSPFLAEIIRAGIEAIPKGQYESALALGFQKTKIIFRIILPQAVKIIFPNIVNEYITILKLTSLASIIAVTELVSSANTLISNSYRPLEIYTALALMYVIIVVPISYLVKNLERDKTKRYSNVFIS
jgi:polar amino acid transport system permease protein